MAEPIAETISAETAVRFYNWLGRRHDFGERYERAAKQQALTLLDVQPGQRVLNVGVGTGKEQVQLVQQVGAAGTAVGLDLSPHMLAITRERAPSAPLLTADAHHLPFAADAFDRLLATYVLDLLPLAGLPALLAEMKRVLRGNGRLVLVSLTEGIDLASKAVIGAWKVAYRLHPLTCGGCRPLQLYERVQQAGFGRVMRDVVVQGGVPSEIILAAA